MHSWGPLWSWHIALSPFCTQMSPWLSSSNGIPLHYFGANHSCFANKAKCWYSYIPMWTDTVRSLMFFCTGPSSVSPNPIIINVSPFKDAQNWSNWAKDHANITCPTATVPSKHDTEVQFESLNRAAISLTTNCLSRYKAWRQIDRGRDNCNDDCVLWSCVYGDNCDCATRSLLGVKEDTVLMKVQSLQGVYHVIRMTITVEVRWCWWGWPSLLVVRM